MVEENLTIRKLREVFSSSLLDVTAFRSEVTALVKREDIVRICRFLHDDPDLQYDFLSDLTGVDRLGLGEGPRFEVVYHLYSIPHRWRVRLKVRVAEDAAVPSVTSVWETANWHEREVYDMFGIPFEGHPDLRRIILPEDFEGHPLRKDFPVQAAPPWWEDRPLRGHPGVVELPHG
jgi:NADH-quinone oxidoreductase subunit C